MNTNLEIHEILKKRAVDMVDPKSECEDQFISILFECPQKDGGGGCPVLFFNLKQLNNSVTYEHFKIDLFG